MSYPTFIIIIIIVIIIIIIIIITIIIIIIIIIIAPVRNPIDSKIFQTVTGQLERPSGQTPITLTLSTRSNEFVDQFKSSQ